MRTPEDIIADLESYDTLKETRFKMIVPLIQELGRHACFYRDMAKHNERVIKLLNEKIQNKLS